MRIKSISRKPHLIRNDSGAISFQGILVLLVIIGIVWGAISLLPLMSIPMDLENAIKEAADDWLRLLPREKTQQEKRLTIEEIRAIVVRMLEGHTFDRKELEVIVENRDVIVRLPYTLNINLFGFVMTFDKQLDVAQEAISF